MEHAQKPIEDASSEDSSFLEPYYAPKRFSAKFWRNLIMVVATIAAVFYFKAFIISSSLSRDELKESLGLSAMSSQWVVKEKINTQEMKGILLVPEITFKVKNTGQKTLNYVYFLAVFRFEDTGKSLGEGFRMTLKKGLKTGEESDLVRLVSMGGYKASSTEAFMKNKDEWRRVFVDLFAQSKNSGMASLGKFYVAKKIEGQNIEVKI